jgi:hypothetical protein
VPGPSRARARCAACLLRLPAVSAVSGFLSSNSSSRARMLCSKRVAPLISCLVPCLVPCSAVCCVSGEMWRGLASAGAQRRGVLGQLRAGAGATALLPAAASVTEVWPDRGVCGAVARQGLASCQHEGRGVADQASQHLLVGRRSAGEHSTCAWWLCRRECMA